MLPAHHPDDNMNYFHGGGGALLYPVEYGRQSWCSWFASLCWTLLCAAWTVVSLTAMLSVFPVLCVVSAFAIPVFMCGLAASVGLIALMHVAVFLESKYEDYYGVDLGSLKREDIPSFLHPFKSAWAVHRACMEY